MTDLNHIELPAFTVVSLYENMLVQAGENTAPAVNAAPAPMAMEATPEMEGVPRSLGGNAQKVLVLVDYADAVYLPDKTLEFLTTILGACKLSLADVAIVNIHAWPGISYQKLSAHFHPRVVLHFAIGPERLDLPLHYPMYQLQPFAGCTFLYAAPLEAMADNKNEKMKLWSSLKRLFNI